MKKVIQANTASEFIDYLRLTNPIWDMQVPGNTRWINREKWAFRGQSNADWSLTPSAFRANNVLGFKPGAARPSSNPTERKEQERRVLQDFLFFADRMGLKVPGDNIHFRVPQLPGHPPRPSLDFWPWESVMETLAIAQHHGVPTRLLDFTYDPMVASFFAAYDAWEQMDRPSIYEELTREEKIAVWAIHLPLLYSSVGQASSSDSPPRVILVTAPLAENSYLDHQDGFFILDVAADDYGYPPIEQAIDDIKRDLLSIGDDRYKGDQVFQLTLSWNHVPELLAKLWNELYTIAKLMPTHDKAVQALRDHIDLFPYSERPKQELLSGLLETRTAILQEASQLSSAAQNTIFLGVWSVVDLIAHLVGWDFTNMEAAKDIQAEKLPKFYSLYDKDWKTYNDELVAKYKRDDFDELLALARDSHNQLMANLESIPAEAFEQDFGVRSGGGYIVTIAGLLQAELKDGQEHLKQIQEFGATL